VLQAQLEDVLFSIVRAKGFDEAYIDCYRMVTQFYQSRQPLCIIICGAAWTGKAQLLTLLPRAAMTAAWTGRNWHGAHCRTAAVHRVGAVSDLLAG
jgi:hypothetical protein